MYFSDHAPPHFHAVYAEHEAALEIASGKVLWGSLPDRALRLVREWTAMHHNELEANWRLVQQPSAPEGIAPLP